MVGRLDGSVGQSDGRSVDQMVGETAGRSDGRTVSGPSVGLPACPEIQVNFPLVSIIQGGNIAWNYINE